jgi:hypothetical protein
MIHKTMLWHTTHWHATAASYNANGSLLAVAYLSDNLLALPLQSSEAIKNFMTAVPGQACQTAWQQDKS